jgi:hypothetical protein
MVAPDTGGTVKYQLTYGATASGCTSDAPMLVFCADKVLESGTLEGFDG